MKKILALALGMLLIPFTAFGMQTMDEASMDSVTGQSGVAISVSNVGIYSEGDTVWYQAGPGLEDEEYSATWVGITSGNEVMLIDPHPSPQSLVAAMDNDALDAEGTTFLASPLMIQTSDSMAFLNGANGVLITLGTLDIRTYGDAGAATEIGLSETPADGFDSTYGRILETNTRTVILGGQIGITTVEAYEDTLGD